MGKSPSENVELAKSSNLFVSPVKYLIKWTKGIMEYCCTTLPSKRLIYNVTQIYIKKLSNDTGTSSIVV